MAVIVVAVNVAGERFLPPSITVGAAHGEPTHRPVPTMLIPAGTPAEEYVVNTSLMTGPAMAAQGVTANAQISNVASFLGFIVVSPLVFFC